MLRLLFKALLWRQEIIQSKIITATFDQSKTLTAKTNRDGALDSGSTSDDTREHELVRLVPNGGSGKRKEKTALAALEHKQEAAESQSQVVVVLLSSPRELNVNYMA